MTGSEGREKGKEAQGRKRGGQGRRRMGRGLVVHSPKHKQSRSGRGRWRRRLRLKTGVGRMAGDTVCCASGSYGGPFAFPNARQPVTQVVVQVEVGEE